MRARALPDCSCCVCKSSCCAPKPLTRHAGSESRKDRGALQVVRYDAAEKLAVPDHCYQGERPDEHLIAVRKPTAFQEWLRGAALIAEAALSVCAVAWSLNSFGVRLISDMLQVREQRRFFSDPEQWSSAG